MYLFQRCCCCCGYMAARVPLLSIPLSNALSMLGPLMLMWVYIIRACFTNVLNIFYLKISNSLSYSQFHIECCSASSSTSACVCSLNAHRTQLDGWLCMTATGLNTKAPKTNRCLTYTFMVPSWYTYTHTQTKQPKSCTTRTNFNNKINKNGIHQYNSREAINRYSRYTFSSGWPLKCFLFVSRSIRFC